MWMAACSSPPENAEKANSNSEQKNGAATAQPQVAKDGTPTATNNASPPAIQPPAAQSAPVPTAAKTAETSAKSGEKAAPAGKAPKLLVPEKKLDFGKQPQDKTIARTFRVKNVGNADLNIESVTPG